VNSPATAGTLREALGRHFCATDALRPLQ